MPYKRLDMAEIGSGSESHDDLDQYIDLTGPKAVSPEAYLLSEAAVLRARILGKLMTEGAYDDGGWAIYTTSASEQDCGDTLVNNNQREVLIIGEVDDPDLRVSDGSVRIIAYELYGDDGDGVLLDYFFMTSHNANTFFRTTTTTFSGNIIDVKNGYMPVFLIKDGRLILTVEDIVPPVDMLSVTMPDQKFHMIAPFGNGGLVTDRIYNLQRGIDLFEEIVDHEPTVTMTSVEND